MCGDTRTVFGPGFLPVLVGRHLTLAIASSFPGAFGPARIRALNSGKGELERRASKDLLRQISIRRKRLISLGNFAPFDPSEQIRELQARLAMIEGEIKTWFRRNDLAKRLATKSPILEMRPMRSLPALESALGVSPSEAANWRADVNRWGSVIDAARAEAVM